MVKIIHITNDLESANAFYRGVGVMGQITKEYTGISYEISNTVHWSILKQHDILFLNNPMINNHLEIIYFAKKLNLKVWVDYDDLIFDLDVRNPFLKIMKLKNKMSKDDIKNNVETILNLADLVTVSTYDLEIQFSKFTDNNKIYLVSNARDDYMFNRPTNISNNNLVLWRGTESHKSDLVYFEDDFVKLFQSNPETNFVFWGYKYKIFEKFKNVSFKKPASIINYFHELFCLRPKLMLVPLSPSFYNFSKSNIAAIEANLIGAACICPNISEWDNVGLQYENNFFECANILINSEIERKKCFDLATDTIEKYYMLHAMNELRANLAKELMQLED